MATLDFHKGTSIIFLDTPGRLCFYTPPLRGKYTFGQKRKDNNDGNDELLQQPVLVLLLLCIGLPAA